MGHPYHSSHNKLLNSQRVSIQWVAIHLQLTTMILLDMGRYMDIQPSYHPTSNILKCGWTDTHWPILLSHDTPNGWAVLVGWFFDWVYHSAILHINHPIHQPFGASIAWRPWRVPGSRATTSCPSRQSRWCKRSRSRGFQPHVLCGNIPMTRWIHNSWRTLGLIMVIMVNW